MLGESTSPFIDEGDDLTSEKERDGGYKRSVRTLAERVKSDGSPAMS